MKNLNGRWAVLPAIGFGIAAFCLCFAGAVFTTVQEEKAQPYKIIISAEGTKSLSDKNVVEISQIEDVTAATPVLQVPVSISMGEYTAELTLTGINSDYLEGTFSQGGFFPDGSVMPYIMLSIMIDDETHKY